MMRAQLIELTPDSETRSRKRWSLNMSFTSALAVVEIAFDRQGVDILGFRGGHLPLLDGRNAAMREEHEHVGALLPGERVDRGTAGIAGCRGDDRRAFAALGEDVIHQPRQQLHRHVLEGQRRTVEQFQDERVLAGLHDRADGFVAKRAIGLVDDFRECRCIDVITDERRQQSDCELGIGKTAERTDLGG